MEKNIKLEGMRCSAFYRPQRLDLKVLSSFIDKTAGSSALHVESINSDIVKPYCLMVSSDKRIRIGITNDRMDSQIALGEKEEKGIEETKDICSHYVEVILEIMGVKATRLAIVPVYRYRGDHASYTAFYKQIFSDKFTSFKNSDLLPSEINQLFRVSEDINNVARTINYMSKFYILEKVDGGKKVLMDMMELDINTAVGQNYLFNGNDVKAFFKAGPKFCEDYIKHFFKNDDE